MIDEEAGVYVIMVLECVLADIRAHSSVTRMSGPGLIREVKHIVAIPFTAEACISYFVEAFNFETIGVGYIDESGVLTPPTMSIASTRTAFVFPLSVTTVTLTRFFAGNVVKGASYALSVKSLKRFVKGLWLKEDTDADIVDQSVKSNDKGQAYRASTNSYSSKGKKKSSFESK
ncbi:pyridoxal 5'-phosphate synthase subunit pyroA-like [Dioscorea cayenensis subsp. rotundata]|uniref:pyridoxal 5'-phosphate synthase (glutamine hydrolyzing) n=1 Tax=Dioscorea cayennensis subsp. rotundata TaxID=55577 RepID=A0AB40D3R6_DIOCR|nr:pyridoxal 5'-phosphate synthase subunit pyroA-like [Dioscorea cayenensis subsp. rotundata]